MKSMKKLKRLILPLLALFVFASATAAQEAATAEKKSPVPLQTTQKMRNETRYMVFCLERAHYQRTAVTDLDVREFIRLYMQNIDFFKLFFTAADVQYFQDLFAGKRPQYIDYGDGRSMNRQARKEQRQKEVPGSLLDA